MVRVTRGTVSRRKHNKLASQAKGMIKSRRHSVKRAHEAVVKKISNQYIGRKLRKRDMRRLWIMRINAACRMHETTYSEFIHLLNNSNLVLDRKVLADIAFDNPEHFGTIIAELREQNEKIESTR
jgi:large subunit ribosomal protein L20